MPPGHAGDCGVAGVAVNQQLKLPEEPMRPNRKLATRIRLALVAVAMAGAFTAVTTQPAHASAGDCVVYLQNKGYAPNRNATLYCGVGDFGSGNPIENYERCYDGLTTRPPFVLRWHATEACQRAGR